MLGTLKKASLNKDACHIIDFMPTFAEIAQVSYPKTYKGNDILPFEGQSLVNIFKNHPFNHLGPLFWEHEGNRVVMKDNFKLVSEFPGQWRSFYPDQSGQWELYNLEKDRGELNDLSKKYPEKAAQLSELYNKWAERAGVVDWQKIGKSKT